MAGERPSGTEPQPKVIKARAGERFPLPLTAQDLASTQDVIGSRRFVAGFLLEIQGVGNGALEVFQDENFVSADQKDLRRTPAGPVKLGLEIADGHSRVDPDTLPVTFSLQMYDLKDQQIQSTGSRIFYGSQSFEAQGRVILNEETSPTELAVKDAYLDIDQAATLDFKTWIDPKTGEPCLPYFPKSVVKDVEFAVDNYATIPVEQITRSSNEEGNIGELLEGVRAYPALQSVVLETLTDQEWERHVDSLPQNPSNTTP